MSAASNRKDVILPPATIGILGGGQLGRMSILAGRKLGYRFVVYEPQGPNSPAGVIADEEINAPYDDMDALRAFAQKCDVVTYEFENVPSGPLQMIASYAPVRPGAKALHTCQNRRREKTFLQDNGFPCAPFAIVNNADELQSAWRQLGGDVVVKSADFGYDGKGQRKLKDGDDVAKIWRELNVEAAVLEKWIRFKGEYSVICARNARGDEMAFPLTHNEHRNHILHQSLVPVRGVDAARQMEAEELAMSIARALDVEGLLAVELFLTEDGWIVNELAPRPHNSGHYTFDACLTSQFEQHIRAICNLPLGDPRLLSPVAMINLLGDSWKAAGDAGPDWPGLLEHPRAKLHLYGKAVPKAGRKMGHFCVMADTAADAAKDAEKLLNTIERRK
ncbi:MAG: 5-(carboxyamino)imidazole ribonucleotide synthase [Verrucomicrobiota bacterium JB022]|nr:5-(carboxyamino)imidazole ribonucleotide synthase [Verrucomicrobiota bacterium JB022]